MSEPDCIHEYKIGPSFFDAVVSGRKTFEIRIDDRAGEHRPRVGCIMRLAEWKEALHSLAIPGEYTGSVVDRRVAYRLDGGQFGLPDNLFVAGFDVMTAMDNIKAEIKRLEQQPFDELAQALRERDTLKAGGCICWQEKGGEESHDTHCPKQAAELMEGYCKQIRYLNELHKELGSQHTAVVLAYAERVKERDEQKARAERLREAMTWIGKRFCHGNACIVSTIDGPHDRCVHRIARETLEAVEKP